jgi:hypothetical protein
VKEAHQSEQRKDSLCKGGMTGGRWRLNRKQVYTAKGVKQLGTLETVITTLLLHDPPWGSWVAYVLSTQYLLSTYNGLDTGDE